MSHEESFIQLLLSSPVLNQAISGKLAVTELFHDLALLLGLAEHFNLAAPQVCEFGDSFIPHCNSPRARPVACQLKLHFRDIDALAQFLLKLQRGICPVQFSLLPLLLRLHQLAGDHLQA